MIRLDFYLRKDATHYYHVAPGGSVEPTTQQKAVTGDITNFKEIELGDKRHERLHGVFRKTSLPIKFAKKAAKILRYLYYSQGGMMAKCQLYVTATYDYRTPPEQLYLGDIDFTTFKDGFFEVSVEIMEAGITSLINAYERTDFEIPILPTDTPVLMDGIYLRTRYRYLTEAHTDHIDTLLDNALDVGIIFVRQEGDLAAGFGSTVVSASTTAAPIFEADYDTDIILTFQNVEVEYDMDIGDSNGFKINYLLWDGAPGSTQVGSGNIYTSADFASNTTGRVFINTATNISMQAGWTLEVFITMKNSGGSAGLQYTFFGSPAGSNSNIIYIETSTLSAEQVQTRNIRRGLRWGVLLARVVDKVTKGQYGVQSNYINNENIDPNAYFDAIPYRQLVISEQALKGIVQNPIIKTNLSDMQKDALAGMAAGFGTDGNSLIVEHISHFYQKDSVICEITQYDKDSLQIEVFKDAVINNATIGYQGGDSIDDLNKTDEYNTEQGRRFPIERLYDAEKQTWDLVRPYSAGIQYIELVRAQNLENHVRINNTQRTDAGRNFLLYLSSEQMHGGYLLKRGDIVSGIYNPQGKAYNIPITPARNFRRLAPLAKSYLYGQVNQVVTFETSEQTKDKPLVSTVSNAVGSIAERGDIDFSAINTPVLFQPVTCRLRVIAPRRFTKMVEENKYGVIRIKIRGKWYEWFILETTIKPSNRYPLELYLLSSPKNNLEDLIM